MNLPSLLERLEDFLPSGFCIGYIGLIAGDYLTPEDDDYPKGPKDGIPIDDIIFFTVAKPEACCSLFALEKELLLANHG